MDADVKLLYDDGVDCDVLVDDELDEDSELYEDGVDLLLLELELLLDELETLVADDFELDVRLLPLLNVDEDDDRLVVTVFVLDELNVDSELSELRDDDAVEALDLVELDIDVGVRDVV